MRDARSGRFHEVRDGNLSRILSRIQDEGPAAPDIAAAEPAVSATDDAPQRRWEPNVELTVAPDGWTPPLGDAAASGGRDIMAALLREAEPSRSPQAERPLWWPSASAAMPTPARADEETDMPKPTAARGRRPGLLLAATLAAAVVAGGITLTLYRVPADSPIGAEAQDARTDLALSEEMAAIKASIAALAAELRARDAGGAGERPTGGAAIDLAGQIPDRARAAEATEELEKQMTALAHRLDAVTAQFAQLVAQGEHAADAVTVERLAPPDLPGPAIGGGAPTAAANPAEQHDEATPVDADAILAQPAPSQGVPDAPSAAADASTRLGHAAPAHGPDGALDAAGAITAAASSASGDGRQVAAVEPSAERGWSADRVGGADPATPADAVPTGPETAGPPESDAAQEWLQRLASFLEQQATTAADGSAVVAGGAADRPAEAAAAETAATASSAGETWFINLIAVRQESAALDLQRAYRAKGVAAQVVPIDRSGLFGVRIAGFQSRDEAMVRAAEIKARLGIREVWIGRS